MPDSSITKKALAQTMKELMAKQPFSKISVGDICDACGMSRKSFYYHFRDKYDLVNWIFDTEFLQSIRPENYTAGWKLLADMCTYFYEEKEFYRCAMQIEGQNSFREYFCEAITPLISFFSKDVFDGVENADFYITFFSDAILMVADPLAHRGCADPSEGVSGTAPGDRCAPCASYPGEAWWTIERRKKRPSVWSARTGAVDPGGGRRRKCPPPYEAHGKKRSKTSARVEERREASRTVSRPVRLPQTVPSGATERKQGSSEMMWSTSSRSEVYSTGKKEQFWAVLASRA